MLLETHKRPATSQGNRLAQPTGHSTLRQAGGRDRGPRQETSTLLLRVENFVDQAVFFGLSRAHKEVALDVARNVVTGLASRLHQNLGDHVLGMTDLASLDLDVGRLT